MPDWKQHIRPHLTALRLSPTREKEIIDELAQHLDDRWRELIAGGASEEEAMRLALALLRDTTLARNLAPLRQSLQRPPATPGVSTGHWVSDLGRDVRYAARLFRRQPGFAVTAVLTLALGLGSATALFAWADRLFLRPLPVSEPGRVFNVGERSENGRVRMAFSYPEYLEYRRLDHAFAGLVAFDPSVPVELDAGTGAERAHAALVSANFFAVLGVSPILGRTFDSDADKAPGAQPVAVLSYAAWQRLFSGDREVVGRTLRLNGHVFTITGVAPRDFTGLMRGVFPSLFVPVSMLGQVRPSWTARPLTDANHAWLAVTARLPKGTSAEQAGEAATASARALTGTTRTLALISGSRGRGDSVQALAASGMLFSAAAAVLLIIVCANVSGLFLARVAGRQREFATRLRPWRQSLAPLQILTGRGLAHDTARWSTRFGLGQRSGARLGTHGANGPRCAGGRHSHLRLRVARDAGHHRDCRPRARGARRAGRHAGLLEESCCCDVRLASRVVATRAGCRPTCAVSDGSFRGGLVPSQRSAPRGGRHGH